MSYTAKPRQADPITVNTNVYSDEASVVPVLSVVIPAMNEERSIGPLYERLTAALAQVGAPYEIIFVDDGSTDGTYTRLVEMRGYDPRVRVVQLRRNFGKTPALVSGFALARGAVIFTMDADLQDDPAELGRFLAKLDEGYDVVSGWKRPRHDPPTKS